jgi:hypothetical protein
MTLKIIAKFNYLYYVNKFRFVLNVNDKMLSNSFINCRTYINKFIFVIIPNNEWCVHNRFFNVNFEDSIPDPELADQT